MATRAPDTSVKKTLKTGVYLVKNTATGQVYVGSSLNCDFRMLSHKKRLSEGRHRNAHLQNSWNKYGEEAFTFEILRLCSKEQRFSVEQAFIERFRSFESTLGFNLSYPVRTAAPHPIHSSRIKESWSSLSDEAFNERVAHLVKNGPRQSKRLRKSWKNPIFREERLAGLARGREKTNSRKDAEFVEKRNKNLTAGRLKAIAKLKSPEGRKNQSRNAKLQMRDPERHAKAVEQLRIGRDKINAAKKLRVAQRLAESNDIV